MSRNKGNFLKDEFSWGVILRTDLETIDQIKKFIAEQDAHIIYQTTAVDRLYIIKEDEWRSNRG